MKTIVIYDDAIHKSELIRDIIGEKGFGEVVINKKKNEDRYREMMEQALGELLWFKNTSVYQYSDIMSRIASLDTENVRVVHAFADFYIVDSSQAQLTFRKTFYVDDVYTAYLEENPAAVLFPSVTAYGSFCKNVLAGEDSKSLAQKFKGRIPIEGVMDIGNVSNFILCISGNFDSRFFNSVSGDQFIVEKKSSNRKKIKSEYTFYQLVPEDMKYWFVMPFDYRETPEYASYKMERLHMTDLAIKWVHGSMDPEEFGELMDRYFYFFRSRHSKDCSAEQYAAGTDGLFVEKVHSRIAELKGKKEFEPINRLLELHCDTRIDALVEKYFRLKEKIEKKLTFEKKLVIGHGDPCFANALYSKATKTLKFIDPKGALTEEQLWTNAYYDIAKLSHSVCGNYDFFNNNLYEIRIGRDFSYELEIQSGNQDYVEIFRRKAEENGYDYWAVRIYEVSLFLSMLPLHIDNPHKVFGFILNAKQIMEEIEKNV